MSLLQTVFARLPDFLLEVARLCLWLALLTALFMPLERWFALRKTRPDRRALLQDLSYYFLTSLIPAFLLGLPLALIAQASQHIIPAEVTASVAALPLGLRLLLAFVIGEIGFYWGHRLSHEIPWLWRFHAIHHSAEHIYYLVNTRAHPVDIVVTRLFGLLPLYILGLAGPSAAGSVTPVAVILLGTLWGFFIHANLRFRCKPLELLIATPLFHHWHHSRLDHINRNYAAMLPVLDRVFGSYYLPSSWPTEYGVEKPVASTLSGQMLIRSGEVVENGDRNGSGGIGNTIN